MRNKSLNTYFVKLRVYATNGHYWCIEVKVSARDPHDALDLIDAWSLGLKTRPNYSSTYFVALSTEQATASTVYALEDPELYEELNGLWTSGD